MIFAWKTRGAADVADIFPELGLRRPGQQVVFRRKRRSAIDRLRSWPRCYDLRAVHLAGGGSAVRAILIIRVTIHDAAKRLTKRRLQSPHRRGRHVQPQARRRVPTRAQRIRDLDVFQIDLNISGRAKRLPFDLVLHVNVVRHQSCFHLSHRLSRVKTQGCKHRCINGSALRSWNRAPRPVSAHSSKDHGR